MPYPIHSYLPDSACPIPNLVSEQIESPRFEARAEDMPVVWLVISIRRRYTFFMTVAVKMWHPLQPVLCSLRLGRCCVQLRFYHLRLASVFSETMTMRSE